MCAAAYFNAAVPEPYRILGLTLKPLSLGRYRLLRRFDCAFVAEGPAQASFADLLLGVLICSMRVDAFLEWANSADFAKDVRAWGRRVSPRAWVSRIPGMGKWWRKRHSFDAVQKEQLFRSYVEAGSRIPKFWDETGGSTAAGGHWSQAAEVSLRAELNWSAEEVNEEPLSKALADYCKWLEAKGQIRLMNEEELAQIEAGGARFTVMINGRPATPEELEAMAKEQA